MIAPDDKFFLTRHPTGAIARAHQGEQSINHGVSCTTHGQAIQRANRERCQSTQTAYKTCTKCQPRVVDSLTVGEEAT
jgi:hypothetical protein